MADQRILRAIARGSAIVRAGVEVVLGRPEETEPLIERSGPLHERSGVEADEGRAPDGRPLDAGVRQHRPEAVPPPAGVHGQQPQHGTPRRPRVRVESTIRQECYGPDELTGDLGHEDLRRCCPSLEIHHVGEVHVATAPTEEVRVHREGVVQQQLHRRHIVWSAVAHHRRAHPALTTVRPAMATDNGGEAQAPHIVIRRVSARLFLESQDHQHDLIKELKLIDLGDRFDLTTVERSRELASLIGGILARFDDVRSTTRRQAQDALARGHAEVDLEVPVVDGMAAALRDWLDLMNRADLLCDGGELLLVPASAEVRALRHRYVEQILAALDA